MEVCGEEWEKMCQDYEENTLDYAGILTVNKVDVKAFLMYQTVSSEKKYFKKLFELSGSPKRSWSPLQILNKNLEMCCVKENIFFKLNTEWKETANYSVKEALVCKTHIVNCSIKSGGPKGVQKGGGGV